MKFRNKKSAFLTISCLIGLIGISLYSCVKDAGQLPVPVSQSFCDTVNTKFSSVQLPMLQTYCAIPGCHDGSGGGPGNFNLHKDVELVALNGKLRERVIVLKNMPASAPLPDSLIQKLNCWLNKGAKNN